MTGPLADLSNGGGAVLSMELAHGAPAEGGAGGDGPGRALILEPEGEEMPAGLPDTPSEPVEDPVVAAERLWREARPPPRRAPAGSPSDRRSRAESGARVGADRRVMRAVLVSSHESMYLRARRCRATTAPRGWPPGTRRVLHKRVRVCCRLTVRTHWARGRAPRSTRACPACHVL